MRGAYPWDLYHVKCRVYPVDADRNHQMFPLSAGGLHQLDCHHRLHCPLKRERASFMHSLTHLLTHLLPEDGKPLPLHHLHSSPHQARPVSAVSNLPTTNTRKIIQ